MSAQPGQPSPSQRGGTQRRRFGITPAWILIGLALFAINYWAGTQVTQGPERIRVPYSPFFLQEVRIGNVAEITSKGTAIQGTFKKAASYQNSSSTTRFETEIPTFADTNQLSQLLVASDVVQNAEPLQTGVPWWENLLVGFGPTLLFLGLLFWFFRRSGSAQNALGSFGRSRARRYEAGGDRVTFKDVAGIDGEGRADRGRRLPAPAAEVPAAWRPRAA